jgi:hypothetical protein
MAGSWRISIPSQGVSLGTTDTETVLKFLNTEINYYNRLGFSGSSVTLANTNYGNVNITSRAVAELSNIITEVRDGKTAALDSYIANANDRLILVGASPVGKRVEQLKESSPNGALILASIFSWNWLDTNQGTARDILATFRAIAFANPANLGFDNLLDAAQTAKQSREAWEASKKEIESLGKFIDEKTQLFENLESLYRKQLTIQEPAISWQKIAAQKTTVWRVWLALFALLVVLPIFVAIFNWETVSIAVGKVTASANGGFSIAGLAVVSIPALFYAWLLKNISRVFIQNLNLADDADHRRSLALTYMGLLQDDKRPASDADRAIILNALFRPIPPHTNDEGPPAGLIDLIKR